MFGGQVSLGIAFFAAIFSLAIGITVGMTAGYNAGTRFGFIDDFINWVITTLTSIPGIYLLLIVSAVIRSNPTLSNLLSGPWLLIIILSLLGWTGTARLVRGETLSIREREYIVASRAIGATPVKIMASHILPNLFSVVAISLAGDIGGLILTEAALSFLGLGVSITTPSWGNMLNSAQNYYTKGAHLVVVPGLFIFIAVLCLFIVGDGFRDAFDPTSRD
jgi:peptide/nickel transport system permease protein